MLSILLIVLIILMVMSRNFDIDLDIKGLESFNPIKEEDVVEVKDEVVKVVKVVKEVIEVFVKEKDKEIEDLLSNIKRVKGSHKQRDPYAKQFKTKIKDHSKRGDHGHKGYTRVQTLAYKKARAFKTAHLNEWC